MSQYLFKWPEKIGMAMHAVNVLRYLLGVFFIFMSVKNLMGDQHMISEFDRWGLSSLRVLIAIFQLLMGVCLFIPSISFWAAGLLVLLMIGAAIIHLRYDSMAQVISPVVFLFLLSSVAYFFRPERFL